MIITIDPKSDWQLTVRCKAKDLAATCCWRPAHELWPLRRKSAALPLRFDAKDEKAAKWYERFGALVLLDVPLKLVLPLDLIVDAIAAVGKGRR
jgi:hypothetical protein